MVKIFGRLKLCVAAGMYVGTTILKIASPTVATGLKERVLPALDQSDNYVTAVAELGAKINESKGFADAIKLIDGANAEADEDYSAIQPYAYVIFSELYDTVTAVEPGEEHAAELLAQQDERRAVLEAEKKAAEAVAQQTYAPLNEIDLSEETLPENVSYEFPELPFEYGNPVSGICASGFGYRVHPIEGEVKFHYGTDMSADEETPIAAFGEGDVITADYDEGGYGNYIVIDHGNGYSTLYAHCSSLVVEAGTHVSMGDIIALVGQTGEATGPHLHFEIMLDGLYLDPEAYVAG